MSNNCSKRSSSSRTIQVKDILVSEVGIGVGALLIGAILVVGVWIGAISVEVILGIGV